MADHRHRRESPQVIYRDGVWCGFIRSALLLAIVLCCVDSCFGSWVLLSLFFLVCATYRSIFPARFGGGASGQVGDE